MRKTIVSKFIHSIFIGSIFILAPLIAISYEKIGPDRFEPNNNYKNAVRLFPAQQAWYKDLTITSNDRDWFSVAVEDGQSLHVKIFFRHAEANLDMSIYRLINNKFYHLKTSASNNDIEELLLKDLPEGIYYVYHRDHGTPTRYKMWIDVE